MRVRGAAVMIGTSVALMLYGSPLGSQEQGLRGFLDEEVAAQRAREEAFRAVAEPDNLREYMRTISETPHHAGSPGSRRVAEYVLEQFAAWGLEVIIEEHDALMPMPVERLVELVEPERVRLQLEEPVIPEEPARGRVCARTVFRPEHDALMPPVMPMACRATTRTRRTAT